MTGGGSGRSRRFHDGGFEQSAVLCAVAELPFERSHYAHCGEQSRGRGLLRRGSRGVKEIIREREYAARVGAGRDIEHVAEHHRKVGGDGGHALAQITKSGERGERFARVAREDMFRQSEQLEGIGGAEHFEHAGVIYFARAVADAHIRDGQRIAHTPPPRRRDEAHGVGLRLGSDVGKDLRKPLLDEHERQKMEIKPQTARHDGRGDLLHLGGREDEYGMSGRLLEGLEKRVVGALGQHVDFVDDVDLVASHGGREIDLVGELPHLIHRIVGRRVDLEDIETGRRSERFAHIALAARRPVPRCEAVDGAGEYLGDRSLARAARPREEIGVRDGTRLYLIAERPHDMFLPDDLVESRGAVSAVKRCVSHSEKIITRFRRECKRDAHPRALRTGKRATGIFS